MVVVVVVAEAVDLVEGAAVLVLVAVAVLAPAVALARVAVALSALLRFVLPALHRVRARHGSTSLREQVSLLVLVSRRERA